MMKKLVKKAALVLTVAAMAITGCATSVCAYRGPETGYHKTVPVDLTDTYEIRYVTGVNDSLNVRCDAFADAEVIGSLYNGQEVVVTGYVEIAYKGNYSKYVRINYNGVDGYVDSSYLSDYAPVDPAPQPVPVPDPTPAPQPSYEVDTVVYPRVDKHLSNESRSTWCSLNTDGYYYNENGERFADNGNGTFSDVSGNTYNVIG